jgi:hypothetical protein
VCVCVCVCVCVAVSTKSQTFISMVSEPDHLLRSISFVEIQKEPSNMHGL